MPGPVPASTSTSPATRAAATAAPSGAPTTAGVRLGDLQVRGGKIEKLTLRTPPLPAGARYEVTAGGKKLPTTIIDEGHLSVAPSVTGPRRNTGGFYSAGTGDDVVELLRVKPGQRIDVTTVLADGTRSAATSVTLEKPKPAPAPSSCPTPGTLGDLRPTRDGGFVVVRENGDWSRAPNDIARERAEAARLSRAGYVDVYTHDHYGRSVIRTMAPGESYADAVLRGGNVRDAYEPGRRRYAWDR